MRNGDVRYATVRVITYYVECAPIQIVADNERHNFYTFCYVFEPDGSRKGD